MTVKVDGNPEKAFFFSSGLGTDLSDPLNATLVYVESIFGGNKLVKVKVNARSGGAQNTNGQSVEVVYVDGQAISFQPKLLCAIIVTSPYTGKPKSVFSGEVNDCLLNAGGLTGQDHTISLRFDKTEG
jgi:hypothetical protein